MNLFINESFKSHSGLMLPFKIECDALSDDDIECFARIAHEQMGLPWNQIGKVVAVGERRASRLSPHAPTRLARALRPWATKGGPYALVIDDVYTTGASIADEMAKHEMSMGLVIFAREDPLPGIDYIFALNPNLR